MDAFLRQGKHAVLIRVHVVLRASRDEVEGLHGGALRVRLRAPPVEGAANAALLALLAQVLGIRQNQVEIVSGWSSRNKVVAAQGLEMAEVERRLGLSD